MIQFHNISQLKNIEHGITEIGDTAPEGLILGEQVHKDVAVWVDQHTTSPVKKTDALVTRESKILVGVRIADCTPIVFAEPKRGIVGAVHAGWRGTALEITRKTMDFLKIKPFALQVGIGPAICPNCFEVGEEVARQFDASVVRESENTEGKFHVDLWQANMNQCIEAGIPERNIEVIRRCTLEDPQLYSFRGGNREERNIAFIARHDS